MERPVVTRGTTCGKRGRQKSRLVSRRQHHCQLCAISTAAVADAHGPQASYTAGKLYRGRSHYGSKLASGAGDRSHQGIPYSDCPARLPDVPGTYSSIGFGGSSRMLQLPECESASALTPNHGIQNTKKPARSGEDLLQVSFVLDRSFCRGCRCGRRDHVPELLIRVSSSGQKIHGPAEIPARTR